MAIRLKDSIIGNVSGNASTATTLQTARTINGTSFNGSANITTANWGTARTITIGSTGKSVNGSANVSWSLSEIGAAASSHTHSYLPLSGGTITGKTTVNDYISLGAGEQNSFSKNSVMLYDGAGGTKYGIKLWNSNGSTGDWSTMIFGPNQSARRISFGKVNTNTPTDNSHITQGAYFNLDNWNFYTNGEIYAKGSQRVYHTGYKPTPAEIGAAASSHTHNYAGSSSAGGAATSALACTGNSATATKLATVRGIFGKTFDGSGDITGKALVYGTYTSTASSRYTNGALEIRENGLVGSAQSDIGYAPQLGFHWSGRIAATLAMSSGGEFQFINQAGTGYSNVRAGTFIGALSGNASTASSAATLTTARTINGTSFNGSANITTANWGTARTITIGSTGKSVNGSGNVSWSLAEIGASRAYSASYSFGGNQNAITTAQFITMLTNLGAFSQPHWISRGSWSYASNQYINDTGCGNIHLAGCVVEVFGNASAYTIRVTTPTTSSSGVTHGDFIYVNNGSGYSPGWRRMYSTAFPQTTVSGNAGTATALQTARTINGTSFNGSANITTANWGTARTITIGNTGKSVNGSGNVSWSLAEIGASTGVTANTLAQRDSAGDITARLMKSTYANQTTISGAIAFRVNNSTDNYIRFCSDAAAVRTWLGAAASSHTHTYLPLTGGNVSGTINLTAGTGAIKMSTGGCRIYGLSSDVRLFVEGGIYTNKHIQSAGAYIIGSYSGIGATANENATNGTGRLVRGVSDSIGSVKLQLGGTDSTSSFEIVNPAWNTAWFSCNSSGIKAKSYANMSDKALKINIKESKKISDRISKIGVYTYNYLSDFDKEASTFDGQAMLAENMPEKRWGVIAQEVEEIFPELVIESETLIDGENKTIKSVDVYGLTVLTLEYAKELQVENEKLKERLSAIEDKINSIIDIK